MRGKLIGRIKVFARTYKVYEIRILPGGEYAKVNYGRPSIWIARSVNKTKSRYQRALQVMVNNAIAHERGRMTMSAKQKFDLLDAQDIARDGVLAIAKDRWK